eukprot:2768856-Rhodomonas_salina.2
MSALNARLASRARLSNCSSSGVSKIFWAERRKGWHRQGEGIETAVSNPGTRAHGRRLKSGARERREQRTKRLGVVEGGRYLLPEHIESLLIICWSRRRHEEGVPARRAALAIACRDGCIATSVSRQK